MAYPGGKAGSGVYQAIINQLPPHQVYIEPFLGGGAVMRFKRPAPMASIGIDVDAGALQNFQKAHAATIPNLELHSCSALKWLTPGHNSLYCTQPKTLIYLDPPYLMSTRSTQRPVYKFEFSTEIEHDWLLSLITGMSCMVAISGYWSELYAGRLKGWRSIQYPAMTRGGTIATEWLWMNYPEPLELHDYRYLGTNFRERERINRKKRRWSQRLKTMDPLERLAILSAIDELRSGSATAFSGDAYRQPSPEKAV